MTTSVSNVDRRISGLERDLANLKKSSSTPEERLLVVEVIDGRVNDIFGPFGLPGTSVGVSTSSEGSSDGRD